MAGVRLDYNNNQEVKFEQTAAQTALEAHVLPHFIQKELRLLQRLAEKLRQAEHEENPAIAELLNTETEESLAIAYLINSESEVFPPNLLILTNMLWQALQQDDFTAIQKLNADCAPNRLESAYTLLENAQNSIKKSYLQKVRPTAMQLLQSGGIFGPPGGPMLINEEEKASYSHTLKY